MVQFGTSRSLQAHVDLFVSQLPANGEAIGPVVVVQTTWSLESRKLVPRSLPVKLAGLVFASRDAGVGPITLSLCKLMEINDEAIRTAVLGVLDGWKVSSEATIRIRDVCLWPIKNQPDLELQYRHADIAKTDDLTRFERLKLCILNRRSNFIAEGWASPCGDLALTVGEALAENVAREDLETHDNEVLQVLVGSGLEEEARGYRNTVITRFPQPSSRPSTRRLLHKARGQEAAAFLRTFRTGRSKPSPNQSARYRGRTGSKGMRP